MRSNETEDSILAVSFFYRKFDIMLYPLIIFEFAGAVKFSAPFQLMFFILI